MGDCLESLSNNATHYLDCQGIRKDSACGHLAPAPAVGRGSSLPASSRRWGPRADSRGFSLGNACESTLQGVQRIVHVSLGDAHRRLETQDVAVESTLAEQHGQLACRFQEIQRLLF